MKRYTLAIFCVALLSPLSASAAVTIEYGDSAAIHWLVVGSPTCAHTVSPDPGSPVKGDWEGGTGSAGTQTLGPFNRAGDNGSGAVFTFTCTAGSESDGDTVTVECPPANPIWNGSACVLNVPTVVTNAATLITTTATLNGTGDPDGITATGFYRYSTTNPGTCNNTFGTRLPSSSGTALGAGSVPVSFPRVTGVLTPGQTYYFCALASNVNGIGMGIVRNFTTPTTPTVTLPTDVSVLTTSATLGATVSSDGGSAITARGTCWGTSPSPAGNCSNAPLGIGTGIFSHSRTGLSPGILYYYRGRATNAVGTAYSPDGTFTTAVPPLALTDDATSVLSTTATINGQGDPNSLLATSTFRYGLSDVACASLSTLVTGSPSSLGSGTAYVPFSYALTSLLPATKYYFCARVGNITGAVWGIKKNFTTIVVPPTPYPTAVTLPATSVTTSGARINAEGNPNGISTTATFKYSTVYNADCSLLGPTYTVTFPASGALGGGASPVSFYLNLTGLPNGTTYYYCARTNHAPTSRWGNGAVMSFTTGAPPTPYPTATTLSVTNIDTDSARIHGEGNPNGFSTNASFHFGTVYDAACHLMGGAYPVTNPAGGGIGGGSSPVGFYADVGGLSAGTTYYYCARTNHTGSSPARWGNGAVASFTTSATPPPPPPPPPPVVVDARIIDLNVGAWEDVEVTVPSGSPGFQPLMFSAGAIDCTYSRYSRVPPGPYVTDFASIPIPPIYGGPLGFSWPQILPGYFQYAFNFSCWNASGGSGSDWVYATVLPPNPVIAVSGVNTFPPTLVGNISTRTFNVTNVGDSGSSMSGSVFPTGSAEFYCTGGCIFAGLRPGDAPHVVTVTFAPSEISPPIRQGNVTFTSNGGDNVRTMSGNGLSPLLLVPDPINFGDVVVSKSKTLRMAIDNISNTDVPAFTITGLTPELRCPQCAIDVGIPVGGTRFVDITFIPSIVGPYDLKWALLFGPGRVEKFEVIGNGVPPEWSVVEQ